MEELMDQDESVSCELAGLAIGNGDDGTRQ